MKRLDLFKQNYDKSMAYIKDNYIDRDDPEMSDLVKWLLNTDYNPYSFFQDGYANSMYTAEGFASLIGQIHHAVYDDGEITFVAVNGTPRIVFLWQHEQNFNRLILTESERYNEQNFNTKHDIKVLDIKPNQFGTVYESSVKEKMRELFAQDVAIDGMETTLEIYKKYKEFDISWVQTCAEEIKKWEDFYNQQASGPSLE